MYSYFFGDIPNILRREANDSSTIRPPSSAGNGRRLKNPILIERSAANII
jgi:hypothetical protein